MKISSFILFGAVLIFSTVMVSYTYANDAGNSAVNAVSQETAAQDEEAILKELETLLSENYCPDYDVKKWNFFDPAPACLQEQAKKVAVLVYGPSEFSEEEEKKLRKFVASGKEVQATLKEVRCKPGVARKWNETGGPMPDCLRKEIDIAKELARKNGLGGAQTIIQSHLLDTKLRHLEDMDRLHLLLAQVLSGYSCDADIKTKECVRNFYHSITSKW